MQKEKKDKILKAIIVLGIISLITSIYLIQNHYTGAAKGSVCDISATVSCSIVNTSVYSELFNVSVAIFGALWSLFLILMAWAAMYKDGELLAIILGWSILGTLFVIYMIIAEFLLRAICPFCTVVHVAVFIILGLSIYLYKSLDKRPSFKSTFEAAKPWIIAIILINSIPLIAFNLPAKEPTANYDNLAKCLTEKGVKMYSSFLCGVCAAVRKDFEDSFQYVEEIECHPRGENPQTELCLSKDVQRTPTWTIEQDGKEIKREVGYLSPEDLAEFAGCSQELING